MSHSLTLQAQLCALNAQLAVLALLKVCEDEELTVPKVSKTRNSRRQKTVKAHVNHVPVRTQFRAMQPRK
jgi:hypothetical protein